MILNGPAQKPLSGSKPKSICIMLHGVGADGDNLIGLASAFSNEFPDTFFIAPNGPEKFAGGGNGYQWFPYYERTRPQVLTAMDISARTVAQFTTEILDIYDLKPQNLILMGFSQGAMLAIQTALTMQDNCAGVVSFSGGLLKIEITDIEVRSQPPICLIHGDNDDVVPCQMSESSAKLLADLHVPAEFHKIRNLGHSIDMQCIDIAKGFLHKVVG
jgi:phospholipase/carboxylesterase